MHGEFELLQQALVSLDFDYKCDRLFCVGDLIDRGSQSPRITEFLEFSWFHSIAGNHEWMLYNCHNDNKLQQQFWFPNGGVWWQKLDRNEQLRIIEFVEIKLFSTITIETKFRRVGLVHALAYPYYSWDTFCKKVEYDQVIQQWAIMGT